LDDADDSDFEEGDEYESDNDLNDKFLDEENALEDEPVVTRSGRLSRRNQNYTHGYSHLTAGSLHDEVELSVPTPKSTQKEPDVKLGISKLKRILSNLKQEDTLTIQEDELAYLGVIMTQMSLKQGLKVFGERGEASAFKEMKQLHDMDTFFPRDPRTLTREERVRALSSLIFLKEKRNGDVKSRKCINGAPQRAYIRNEDASSPTVHTDSVFIQGAIDAFEEREAATCNLPGAFLHTVIDEKVIMILHDELCDLMVKVNPSLY
jgi:hypothetical protein